MVVRPGGGWSWVGQQATHGILTSRGSRRRIRFPDRSLLESHSRRKPRCTALTHLAVGGRPERGNVS